MAKPVTKKPPKTGELRSPNWKMRELYEAMGGAEVIIDKIKDAGYAPPPLFTVRGWAFRRSIPTKWLPLVLQIALKDKTIKSIAHLAEDGAQ